MAAKRATLVGLLLVACTNASRAGDASALTDGIPTTESGAGSEGSSSESTSSSGAATQQSDGEDTGSDGSKYDVGPNGVACTAGEFHCQAAKVMQCDTSQDPATWTLLDTCDPSAGEACNQATGTCEVAMPIGGTTPTGEYYRFAYFNPSNSPFAGGCDVGGYDDDLYVTGVNLVHVPGQSNAIDHYRVVLLDSDGDGELEPNQHPDNPDDTGPIEERTLTFVETIPPWAPPKPMSSEIAAFSDRLYLGGDQLTEYITATGVTTTISGAPTWLYNFSHLGHDDLGDVWYASNESHRRVMQYDASDDSWGIAFDYPSLAGTHMDGMDVVIDPSTSTPYVYVSDMTSDFIGQYRLDRQLGWVQENLFSYADANAAVVEGFGWGPLHHFWATGGTALYELGGGDLAQYTDPAG
jgi:hypothetical protein